MKIQYRNQKTEFRKGKDSLLVVGVATVFFLSLGIALQDTSNIGLTEVRTVQANTDNNWTIPLGYEFHDPNWFYGFKVCPNKTIDEGMILVTSDISDSVIDISSPIGQEICKTYSVSIPANDPESIFVSIIEAF